MERGTTIGKLLAEIDRTHRLLPYQGPGRPRVLAMSAAVRVFVLQEVMAKLARAEERASRRRPAAHRSCPTAIVDPLNFRGLCRKECIPAGRKTMRVLRIVSSHSRCIRGRSCCTHARRPFGLAPVIIVMWNTPVEVQFTSAGCLNYPCRTPLEQSCERSSWSSCTHKHYNHRGRDEQCDTRHTTTFFAIVPQIRSSGRCRTVAARLEGLAMSGSLVIADATRRQLGQLFGAEHASLRAAHRRNEFQTRPHRRSASSSWACG